MAVDQPRIEADTTSPSSTTHKVDTTKGALATQQNRDMTSKRKTNVGASQTADDLQGSKSFFQGGNPGWPDDEGTKKMQDKERQGKKSQGKNVPTEPEYSPRPRIPDNPILNQTLSEYGTVYANVRGNIEWSNINTALQGVSLGPKKSTPSGTASKTLPDFWVDWSPRFVISATTVRRDGPAWLCTNNSDKHDKCAVINGWQSTKCVKCGHARHCGLSVVMDFSLKPEGNEQDCVCRPWPPSWEPPSASKRKKDKMKRRHADESDSSDTYDDEGDVEQEDGGRRGRRRKLPSSSSRLDTADPLAKAYDAVANWDIDFEDMPINVHLQF